MQLTIKDAITHSTRITDIVKVYYHGDLYSAMSVVDGVADWYEHTTENDGSEDVWGSVGGDDFRIRITTILD